MAKTSRQIEELVFGENTEDDYGPLDKPIRPTGWAAIAARAACVTPIDDGETEGELDVLTAERLTTYLEEVVD